MIHRTAILPLALSLAATAAATAETLDLLDGTNDLLVPSYRAGMFFNGESTLDEGGEFSYAQFLLRAPLTPPVPVATDVNFFASLDYEVTFLDVDVPALVPLEDADLHMLRVPLTLLRRSDTSPWSWLVRVDPGIATDFNDFNGHDIRFGGRAGVAYTFSKSLTVNAGVGTAEAYGDQAVVPLVGFDWMPADNWLVSLSGPRLSASFQPSDAWILRSAVYLSGGVWNVEVDDESRELTLRSLHAGIGIDRRLTGKLWLTASTGFSFANKIDLSTTSSSTVYDSNADSAWFGYLGLRLAAW
jgi:hypothetical protein